MSARGRKPNPVSDVRKIIESMSKDPAARTHLTPEIETALADEDPQVWLRGALVLCKAIAADAAIQESDRHAYEAMVRVIEELIPARLN